MSKGYSALGDDRLQLRGDDGQAQSLGSKRSMPTTEGVEPLRR